MPSSSPSPATSILWTDQVKRLRLHFETVARELRVCDVSHLPPATRRLRTYLIDALVAYGRMGRFPHNHDFEDSLQPYFIDAHGTRCAMAFLLELAGAGALVARVARYANNARIADLASEAELLRFLQAMGLTVEEAGRIQPSYCFVRAADCICEGNHPAVVADGTIVATDPTAYQATYRIDALYGSSTVLSVGQKINVTSSRGPGDRSLLLFTTASSTSATREIAVSYARGTVSCGTNKLEVTAKDATDALLSADCYGAMGAKDPEWTAPPPGCQHGCGCRSAGWSATSLAPTILLGAALLALARRR